LNKVSLLELRKSRLHRTEQQVEGGLAVLLGFDEVGGVLLLEQQRHRLVRLTPRPRAFRQRQVRHRQHVAPDVLQVLDDGRQPLAHIMGLRCG
jgi:hypothetical protein